VLVTVGAVLVTVLVTVPVLVLVLVLVLVAVLVPGGASRPLHASPVMVLSKTPQQGGQPPKRVTPTWSPASEVQK
jgi:hypothetical protein